MGRSGFAFATIRAAFGGIETPGKEPFLFGNAEYEWGLALNAYYGLVFHSILTKNIQDPSLQLRTGQ
jgi:hypothetical protein